MVEASAITQEQLEEALRLQKEKLGFLGKILLDQGWITDEQLCRAVSETLHISCVNIDSILIHSEVIELVPGSLAVTCDILPLYVHHEILYLGMENPRDIGVIQLVEHVTGIHVRPLLVPQCQLQAMIKKYYHIIEPEEDSPTPSSKKAVQPQKISSEQRKRLGDFLVESGLITPEQLDTALRLQAGKRGFLGQLIVDMGWVREKDLYNALSEMLQVESAILDEAQIDPEMTKFVPESLAVSCTVFPLFVVHKILYLAMENPLDKSIIQLLQHRTGMKVEPLLAPPSQIHEIIRKYYTPAEHPES